MTPHITTHAWTPLTPRATPVPRDTYTNDGQLILDNPYGEFQLSEHAWERVFVRALPHDNGYLLHRAWYALEYVEDAVEHPDGNLDGVCLTRWLWWDHLTDYHKPDTSIHGESAIDEQYLLCPWLDDGAHLPHAHLPRTYADAYPLGIVTWDGTPGNAHRTHPELETVTDTATGALIGHLYVGGHRITKHDTTKGIRRGGFGTKQTPGTHAITWHATAATRPDLSHTHPDRAAAIRHLHTTHQTAQLRRTWRTRPGGQAPP